jgi:hypothetical protein
MVLDYATTMVKVSRTRATFQYLLNQIQQLLEKTATVVLVSGTPATVEHLTAQGQPVTVANERHTK